MGQNKARVMIVDDEQAIRRFLHVALAAQGYTIFEVASGQEAISGAAAHKPEIIILDLGLPDIDGVEVTRLLRQWTQVPIIILSVRGAESDKIAALDAGADDYLTKPFGIAELLARLRAGLRRALRPQGEPVFASDDLKVDLAQRLVTVGGREVQLTPNEYELLRSLVTHAGRVLTHHQLLRQVWGGAYEQEFHMLHVNISNLRRKIEPDPARPRYIVTEPGVGYRLRAAETAS
ncbi:MAG: response regulator [Chloroflexi bacterium]|nr:response regulator [Chloroflexota bacterium]